MEQLKRLRKERGLSQAKLAALADIDPSTMNQIERGAREPSTTTLKKLAAALDVTLAELLDPKGMGRSSSREPSLFNGLDEQRPLRYLRAWRAHIRRKVRRWQEEPPTPREIAEFVDDMTSLVEQGVFDISDATDPSEQGELLLIMLDFERLNAIADNVERDEEAEQRRAAFRLIQEKISA
jgi:transcriptional regulator with XRE-family HTH domain